MATRLPSAGLLLGLLSALLSNSRDYPGIAVAQEAAAAPFQVIFEVAQLSETVPGDTTSDSFTVTVNPGWAPIGAQRFRELVEAGFFDECRFFRVINNFMAQFGISGNPEVAKQWRQKSIKDDTRNHQIGNERGRLSFAMAGPNTRTTQLFINFKNNNNLDGMGFTPFAEVTSGMRVVDRIFKVGEGAPSGPGPSQGKIQEEGNAYLGKAFPKLTYIKSARIKDTSARTSAPAASAPAASAPAASATKLVECEFTTGRVTIEVHPEWAPIGSQRFLELVEAGYFDDSALFRAIKGFLVQFGISGNEALRNEWRDKEKLLDDPLRPDVPIKEGTMAFAGGGTNSRTTQVWIAFQDSAHLGKAPWETPFAQVVGSESLKAVQQIATDYGDAVQQGQIWVNGNSYLKSKYPKLDYIKSCRVTPSITSLKKAGAAETGFLQAASSPVRKDEQRLTSVDAARRDATMPLGLRELCIAAGAVTALIALACRFSSASGPSGKDVD